MRGLLDSRSSRFIVTGGEADCHNPNSVVVMAAKT